ncbi:camp-dependent protein kinase regulatory subunit [Lentinula raphanica]|nr:camp-dependent protein kinase regulatory subunit [Lentinula raphanica]
MNNNNPFPSPSSPLGGLLLELYRDHERARPNDALQFCSNWFQSRLEEQRTRARDALGAVSAPSVAGTDDEAIDPLERKRASTSSNFSGGRNSQRNSGAGIFSNPFAKSSVTPPPNLPPIIAGPSSTSSSAIGFTNPFSPSSTPLSPLAPLPANGTNPSPGDFLHPPNSAIFARRTSVSAESIPIEELERSQRYVPPYHPKSSTQLARIKASIANNFIFRDLDEEQETGVLNAMQEVAVGEGEEVIRQGDVGEYFYVVESGILDCYIKSEDSQATVPTPSSPTSPTTSSSTDSYPPPLVSHPRYGALVASCPPGTSFGELALMYGHPRAATVLSRVPSLLWALDRITFRTIILKAAHRRRTMYEGFLKEVVLLKGLSQGERSKIADALVSRVYEDGENVVKQGEMGDTFFFVEEGEAIVTKRVPRGERRGSAYEIIVGRLIKGDYFGELSLLRLAPRAATVSAIVRPAAPLNLLGPKLKVAALDAPAFTRLLGPLREIMERRAGESYLM